MFLWFLGKAGFRLCAALFPLRVSLRSPATPRQAAEAGIVMELTAHGQVATGQVACIQPLVAEEARGIVPAHAHLAEHQKWFVRRDLPPAAAQLGKRNVHCPGERLAVNFCLLPDIHHQGVRRNILGMGNGMKPDFTRVPPPCCFFSCQKLSSCGIVVRVKSCFLPEKASC